MGFCAWPLVDLGINGVVIVVVIVISRSPGSYILGREAWFACEQCSDRPKIGRPQDLADHCINLLSYFISIELRDWR